MQLRVMRSMIAANNRMISSYEDHNRQLQMMIDTLEREVTRADIHTSVLDNPSLAPPVLTRQTNRPTSVFYPRLHDLINNEGALGSN